MSVIAIAGARPALGAAVARKLGREDFSVVFVSRIPTNSASSANSSPQYWRD
ncbi:hypothetical protein VR010_13480 [Actinomycetaceae bacterium L2_0104]